MERLHSLVDFVGVAMLIAMIAGTVVVVILAIRDVWREHHPILERARTQRPRVDRAPVETPVPSWSLTKEALELWLEARLAASIDEEDA